MERFVCIIKTPNANMVDHLVDARDESHEGKASQASMFCFDNASHVGMSCFDLVRIISFTLAFCVAKCQKKGVYDIRRNCLRFIVTFQTGRSKKMCK